MAPLVYGVIEHWATDLLGAGGLDGALGFPEAQAGGSEGQGAIIEQSTDFMFRVRDEIFIAYAVDAAGEGGGDMGHEGCVAADGMAGFGEVVGIFVAGLEILFEHGPSGGHRGAADVDDFRYGKDQVDQADMGEILRHHVDEKGMVLAILSASVVI